MKKFLSVFLCLAMLLSVVSFAAADEVITLTVMNVQSADAAAYNKLVADFEAQNPDIKIEHISTVNAELKKQVQINAISGNMPDVLQFDNPDFAAFAAGGFLTDITDLAAEWEEMPHYWDATINAVSYQGRLYGMPWECNCIGLWYNKTLLDELGKDVPVTWDDVLDICVAAKEKGYWGIQIPAPPARSVPLSSFPGCMPPAAPSSSWIPRAPSARWSSWPTWFPKATCPRKCSTTATATPPRPS